MLMSSEIFLFKKSLIFPFSKYNNSSLSTFRTQSYSLFFNIGILSSTGFAMIPYPLNDSPLKVDLFLSFAQDQDPSN